MPELASNITINKQTGQVTIDGVEVPWYIRPDPSIYGLGNTDMLSVSLDILTKNVTIVPLKGDEVPNA